MNKTENNEKGIDVLKWMEEQHQQVDVLAGTIAKRLAEW